MKKQIKLELIATLKRFYPASCGSFPGQSGTRVRDIMEQIGIPEYEVNLVFINGIMTNLDATIEGGERVELFPPLCGG